MEDKIMRLILNILWLLFGGLGILLIRELMDSVNYERVRPAAGPAKNVLTLTKELGVRS